MFTAIALAVLVAVRINICYGLQCYSCSDTSDPALCRSTTACSAGQSCFEESRPTQSGRMYSMGCLDIQVCASMQTHTLIGRSTGKRQNGMCHQSCSADNCNNNLCALSSHRESGSFLLVMDSNQLWEIDVPTHRLHQINLQASQPHAFEYDNINKTILWYDLGYSMIIRQPFNRTPDTRDYVKKVATSYYGIALDVVSKLLFYVTSFSSPKIRVLSLETGQHSTVIDTGLSAPQALALDILERKIYWADSSRHTIEVANYNGTNTHSIITGLQRPMSIAFDDENKMLYWADSGTHKIERANINGLGRQTLAVIKGTDYTGLALLGNYLYYTSTNVPSVMRIPISGGTPETFGKSDFTQLHDVKAYDMSRAHTESNICSVRNGGCSHVCIPTSDTTRECLCPAGYNISTSGTTCIYTLSVRLAGSNGTAWQGRVEFTLDNGTTWNTFCQSFSQYDANVICKMLGFEGQDAAVITNASVFGSGNNGFTGYFTPQCTGTEDSITDCLTFPYSYGCSHSNDIGVNCTRAGKLRLVGSNAKDQGRVEILINNKWGTICDDNFGPSEAGVVCGSLGFSRNGVQVKSNSYFGQASLSTPIHIDDVKCVGNEDSLLECQHNKVVDASDCKHKEDVGVICQAAQFAHVRLVGSSASSNQGTLEISIDNGLTWNTICDDSFGQEEAQGVCHMLGFNRIGATARGSAYFGQGNSSSKSLHFDCYGRETSLLNCLELNPRTCSHSEDAGVICPYSNSEQLRLVNGPSANQGRVEISLDNGHTWGTVCSSNFDSKGAGVICGTLGYSRSGATSKGSGVYGQGSSDREPIIHYLVCDGTESTLLDCQRSTSSCSHYYDIGVMCLAELTTRVRLSGGGSCSGKVEISFDNGTTWGTICDDYFGSSEAAVVCKMLGINSTQSVAIADGRYGAGSSSQPILLDDLNCSGDESSIVKCMHKPIGEHDCTHDEDVGVGCIVKDMSAGDAHVRLVGSNSKQGRIEISFGTNATWGTVCDDNFDDNAAGVVCAMLGLQRHGAVFKGNAYFGQGSSSQPILLDNVICAGSENTVLECDHNVIGTHNCQHSEDVGVICQP